ncbi:L-aspartate oxidase, partial [Francisella tularensis subsp. holarctica]|nr:L-aspartate oxidase [Francisella tularensis subsp. holarctica]
AVGEVACTVLHGANRLSSNSLIECVVYDLAASQDILANINASFTECDQKLELFNSKNNFRQQINQIRQLMWDNVGL